MKKVMFVVLIMMLLLAMAIPAFAAGQTKPDVCHREGNGDYILINIADPALDSHMAHGDSATDSNGQCLDTDGDGVVYAVDNCVDVANPDQSDRYGSTKVDACEDDSNGDGTLDVDELNMCVSIDGELVFFKGTGSECTSTPPFTPGGLPNIAVAHGNGAYASAEVGDNNTVTANGDYADASASYGYNNTVTATGDYASALAANGDNNTATSNGDYASAIASFGNNNTATATGDYASAIASFGDNNTATATGACFAEAIGGNAVVVCP